MTRTLAALPLALLAGCPIVETSEPDEVCYYESGAVRDGQISEGAAVGWQITAIQEIEPGGQVTLVLSASNASPEDCPLAVYSSSEAPSLEQAPALEIDVAPPTTVDALGLLVEDRIVPRQYGTVPGSVTLSIPIDIEKGGDSAYISVVGCEMLWVSGYIETLDACIDNIEIDDL